MLLPAACPQMRTLLLDHRALLFPLGPILQGIYAPSVLIQVSIWGLYMVPWVPYSEFPFGIYGVDIQGL